MQLGCEVAYEVAVTLHGKLADVLVAVGQKGTRKGVVKGLHLESDVLVGVFHEQAESVEQVAEEHLLKVLSRLLLYGLGELAQSHLYPQAEL